MDTFFSTTFMLAAALVGLDLCATSLNIVALVVVLFFAAILAPPAILAFRVFETSIRVAASFNIALVVVSLLVSAKEGSPSVLLAVILIFFVLLVVAFL